MTPASILKPIPRKSATKRLISPNKAARLFGLSERQIIIAVAEREIPAHQVGQRYSLAVRDMALYAKRQREVRNQGLDELAVETERLGLYE